MGITTQDIVFGQGNVGLVMTPLIPFNMIIDTDVGVVLTVFNKYLDPDVFDASYFFGKTRLDIIKDLAAREKENPLSIIIKEGYEDVADQLYLQILEREYDMVIDEAAVTNIYNLLVLYDEDPDIHPTIICENEKERTEIKSYKKLKDIPLIMSSEMNPYKMNSYNQYFFKALPDAMPYATHLRRKTIYFARYKFNLDIKTGLRSHPVVPVLETNLNRTSLINMYSEKRIGEIDYAESSED